MWPRSLRTVSLALAVPALVAAPAVAMPWAYDLSAFVYVPPDEDVFVSPVVALDRGALHIEGRYNYEDLETGSAFIGHTVYFKSDDVFGSVVPMIGVVAGNTAGIAPAVNFDLKWNRFQFTTETEIVVEVPDSGLSFIYSWVEATLEPFSWLRVGVAGQRTRGEEESVDVRRGPMLTLSSERGWIGAYWFDPDLHADATYVFAAGFSF